MNRLSLITLQSWYLLLNQDERELTRNHYLQQLEIGQPPKMALVAARSFLEGYRLGAKYGTTEAQA